MRVKECSKIQTKELAITKENSRRASFMGKATLSGQIALNLQSHRVLRSTKDNSRTENPMVKALF